jgi:hypothetical protein
MRVRNFHHLTGHYLPGVGGGTPTDATFVTALYEQLLGRAASPTDIAYLSGVIAGSGRSAAVTVILGSTEWRTRVVSGYFPTLLGRQGTPGEINAFVASWVSWRATRAALEGAAEFYSHAAGLP